MISTDVKKEECRKEETHKVKVQEHAKHNKSVGGGDVWYFGGCCSRIGERIKIMEETQYEWEGTSVMIEISNR